MTPTETRLADDILERAQLQFDKHGDATTEISNYLSLLHAAETRRSMALADAANTKLPTGLRTAIETRIHGDNGQMAVCLARCDDGGYHALRHFCNGLEWVLSLDKK